MAATASRFSARTRLAILVAACLAGHAAASPVAAVAEPVTDPCSLSVTILCHFVPMAPDWEGDIDLTQNQPPADSDVPEPEARQPSDYCFNGCS